MEFLARLLLSPGDTALVTRPTYLGALQAFAAYEPCYDELNPQSGNRTPHSYRAAAAAAGGGVKFAYVVPDFANPTGETLSVADRARLLDLAAELDIPILEDTAYAAVGWVVGPRALIRRLVLIKQASDLNSATVNQMVMHRLAETVYDRQVAAARVHYRQRRDCMLAALARHMPSACSWTQPNGGLFVWLRLPANQDSARLLQRAVDEAGVAFVPGAAFAFDRSGHNNLRLSYSLSSEAEIEAGIARLGQLVRAPS